MGELFGRYVVERRLALGGMAEVCLARQMGPSGFDRVCVLKRMHPALAQLPEIVELFLHEAQLTAQLSHPNIAQVYDFGEVNGAYFMALERVEGPSLREVITWYAGLQQLVPLPLACRVVSEVASALEAAHRAKDSSGAALNLVHRDVSPSNVLVATTGVTKLIDFGIAKTRASLVQTDQGLVRGKVAYMSPEQMRGEVLDGRSDVFSLGLVFYELITGRRAIAGRTDAERFEAAVVGAMVPVETLRPGLPPSLLAVLTFMATAFLTANLAARWLA